MYRRILICSLIILILSINGLSSQSPDRQSFSSTGIEESFWKGFVRYDFQFQHRDARLIVPNKPIPGNPWVWRARFPDWHTEADSILASEGFYVVYINTDNLYGSPRAVSIWDNFYNFLTNEYKLQQKVALAGVSRGGLFIYNWAKKNPEKVACIYAEAPVCDFKSWPAGFGIGSGSLNDWNSLKKEYGFDSDDEAKAYTNNPVDNLESLAKAKIPVLHMVGLYDKIVPPGENTFLLINKYIRQGGIATVVPCTKGVQKLEGHHFPIETPRIVADYIKYNSLQIEPLNSSNYHNMRGGLLNSQIIFERHKVGRVAFLGGSITYNSGWRDSVCNYLTQRFPETDFEFIEAGIPSMGSTPAAFRLNRDVLAHGRIDLLFEEAAVNDAGNGRTSMEQIKAMEGLVRHSRVANPQIDIVLMHFVDPGKMKEYRAGKEPLVISNHNIVADHYKIPTINLAKEITDRIDNEEFNWEDDFKNLHPSPFGQGIYASSIIQLLKNAYVDQLENGDKISSHDTPGKIDEYCYDKGYLMDISSAQLYKGWKIDSSWSPGDDSKVRPNFVNVPMLISKKPGSRLSLKFTGNTVGIAVAAGQDAGIIDYRIDRGDWQSLNLFTSWSNQLHLPWYYTLASELLSKEHLLEIRIASSRDRRSNGNACRIRYFFVNGF